MKKFLILLMLPFIMILGLMLILVILISSGEMTADPVPTFATQEKVEEYQYVGSELGIPWELVLMADGIYADWMKEGSIEEKNPLLTSLEFCILKEYQYQMQMKMDDSGQPVTDADGNIVYEKVLKNTVQFTACEEILSYIDSEKDTFTYDDVSVFVAKLNEQALKKSLNNNIFEVTLLANPDNMTVLTDYIGLTEKYAKSVLEIFEAHYLAKKYGYITDEDDDILADAEAGMGKVEVTIGDVTREELAKVAVSIMNWPYLLGGKSSALGAPKGPLDCSGYVDWVYVQCFGKGVSAGGIPSGIAVSGTAIQYYASDSIREDELKIGDIGFLKRPSDVAAGAYNHVGIYIGEIDGSHAWVHCGGSSFGYADRPRGRVGISAGNGTNNYNPITNSSFAPPMKACNFRYFRRPRFQFKDDVVESRKEEP